MKVANGLGGNVRAGASKLSGVEHFEQVRWVEGATQTFVFGSACV